MYWQRRGAYKVFWWGKWKGSHLEDLDVCGRMILKWSYRNRMDGMDWSNPSMDRDKEQTVLNMEINLLFSSDVSNFSTS
jgi:hypothetical protein